jgi:alanine racemase
MLDLPITHLDAVRIGIAMYGLRPSSEVESSIPLKPALSLKSHIARLRTLSGGSSVGYGRTFVAQGPTQVALIPIGYGDGYHRALSNKGIALIGGQRVPVIGRVSMDQITVDATGISDIDEGDEAVLIGSQGGEHITAEEIAGLAGTINYEVTTSLLPRVPRIYLRGGEIVEVVRGS